MLLSFKSPITYTFVKCGCSNYLFLNSVNLICQGTDISKYFRESLGIRDNESRLYLNRRVFVLALEVDVQARVPFLSISEVDGDLCLWHVLSFF